MIYKQKTLDAYEHRARAKQRTFAINLVECFDPKHNWSSQKIYNQDPSIRSWVLAQTIFHINAYMTLIFDLDLVWNSTINLSKRFLLKRSQIKVGTN